MIQHPVTRNLPIRTNLSLQSVFPSRHGSTGEELPLNPISSDSPHGSTGEELPLNPISSERHSSQAPPKLLLTRNQTCRTSPSRHLSLTGLVTADSITMEDGVFYLIVKNYTKFPERLGNAPFLLLRLLCRIRQLKSSKRPEY